MDMKKEALAKLEAEKKTAKCDRYGSAMKGAVCEALERIKVTDSDKAGKLQGAIRAVVEGMT